MYEEGEVADLLEQRLSLGLTAGSEWLLTEGQFPHLSEACGKTPIFPDVSLDIETTRKNKLQASVLCYIHKLFCEDHLAVIFSSSTWHALRIYELLERSWAGAGQSSASFRLVKWSIRTQDALIFGWVFLAPLSSCSCTVAQLKCGLKRGAVRNSCHVWKTVTLRPTCFLLYFNIFKFSMKICSQQ